MAMASPDTLANLAAHLPAELGALAQGLHDEVMAARDRLAVVFPGLPRRAGRDPVQAPTQAPSGRPTALGPGLVELAAFRRCDLVASWLLLAVAATETELFDLYAHGDIEERSMLLRALHFLPVGPITVRLFGEVQRTNMLVHLEAAIADGDLLARTVGQPGFDLSTANKLLLKLAFLDLPLARALGAERHANAELSQMLQDLATEREAAGRAVWRDTARLLGRAPVPGTLARLLGGLEHGDDGVRLAAAEGLLLLGRPELASFAIERLPRERRPAIRALLERLAGV